MIANDNIMKWPTVGRLRGSPGGQRIDDMNCDFLLSRQVQWPHRWKLMRVDQPIKKTSLRLPLVIAILSKTSKQHALSNV